MQHESDLILERMMALHPKIIDLTLDRMWRLLGALDHPQKKLQGIIHIAGTNGKGSTQAMIRAGLEAAGASTHAYTSPHLARFHERIRIKGELISEEALSAVLETCYQANQGQNITYFEITTVAALLAFSQTPADYTLLEVGLGGRLDATNVIDAPRATVITPIDMDHETFLGDTLEKIATEKAGIIKRGCPCIVGPQQEAALEVIEQTAARLHAPLFVYGQHWHVLEENDRLIYQDEHGLLDLPKPRLRGPHQIHNAGTAIATLRSLKQSEEACSGAVTDAVWPARMERLTAGALVELAKPAELWLDGGHNPAAGRAIAQTLQEQMKQDPAKRPLYMICGMLNTKDAHGYFSCFKGLATQLTALSIPNEAATLSAEETAKIASEAGLNTLTGETVKDAITAITKTAPNARILICGSLYLAGHVIRENRII